LNISVLTVGMWLCESGLPHDEKNFSGLGDQEPEASHRIDSPRRNSLTCFSEGEPMRRIALLVVAVMVLCPWHVSATQQSGDPVKQDANGVGHGAKDLGKSTGKLVGHSTKKGLHAAAKGLSKAGGKISKKTDTDKSKPAATSKNGNN
jgi:hypothetical protein